eukprot:817974-Rhodomonas_salina.1
MDFGKDRRLARGRSAAARGAHLAACTDAALCPRSVLTPSCTSHDGSKSRVAAKLKRGFGADSRCVSSQKLNAAADADAAFLVPLSSDEMTRITEAGAKVKVPPKWTRYDKGEGERTCFSPQPASPWD